MKSFPPARLSRTVGATAVAIVALFASCGSEFAAASVPTTEIEFDHASGFYESGFRVNLLSPVQGATIYYTTNASAPHPAAGLRYRGSIPISTTTVLRATAFKGDTALTDSAARTYLFANSILQQNGDHLPQVWGTNSGSPIPAHYSVSPSRDDAQRREIIAGLQSIPTLSIITDPRNLFSIQNGIYLHPLQRGDDWERPASIEVFGLQDQSGFRINGGLRIHGGMTRRPEESPKHSFRLLFKRRYGAAKLHFPVFRSDGSSEFDELILRAGGSDSWIDSYGQRRQRATYVRDEWMRQSMAAMGYPSARGRFVHLYLNGLYWGIYNLCERPSAPVANQTSSSYDVRNADKMESGDPVAWDKLMVLANSGLADAARYRAASRCLDLTQLADYLILNFYAGNADWSRSANWYAIRPRRPDGKFQFFVWDAEQTFGEVDANTLSLDDDESPMRLFHKLRENAAFRSLFAARAQRLLFANGPLSPEVGAERWRRLTDTSERAMAAESARWGNYRAQVHQFKSGPYEELSVQAHWRPEVNRILSEYIPRRRGILLEQFREIGLFPPADKPLENSR